MAEQHERQRNMEDPAEQPDPFVGLEQAFENRDLAQDAQSRSRPRHRRGRRRNLERDRRPGVLPYAQSEPGGEDRRRNIKHDRVNRGLHANSVPISQVLRPVLLYCSCRFRFLSWPPLRAAIQEAALRHWMAGSSPRLSGLIFWHWRMALILLRSGRFATIWTRKGQCHATSE